ncbi:6-phosphogluconolactonase [bacterium]|nr:6-phosphogluconolactonase [bacterium]
MTRHLVIEPDRSALFTGMTRDLATIARAAVDARGQFLVALAGGSTPGAFFEHLAAHAGDAIPWNETHVFWSDERYVPIDHPDSNHDLAARTLLARVPIPRAHIHPIYRADAGPDEAARAYEETLRAVSGEAVPRLDIVFLGLGDDGHTASIFPGAVGAIPADRLVAAGPIKTHPRVTFTPALINAARNVWFLVTGAAKADMARRAIEGREPTDVIPARLVDPFAGEVFWYLDEAAAARLTTVSR